MLTSVIILRGHKLPPTVKFNLNTSEGMYIHSTQFDALCSYIGTVEYINITVPTDSLDTCLKH